ncbi:MAG TPA: hypothetical protein VKZ50_13265 [bacterium]|nr:hypothetical protein [bacterium]
MPDNAYWSGPERRTITTAEGLARRVAFEDSCELLRVLRLSSPALDFYKQRARETGLLPHEYMLQVVENEARRSSAGSA